MYASDDNESFERALADLEIVSAAYESEIESPKTPSTFPVQFTLVLSKSSLIVFELVDGYPMNTNVQVASYRSSPAEKRAMSSVLDKVRRSAEDCLENQIEGGFTCCSTALEAWEEAQIDQAVEEKDTVSQDTSRDINSFNWIVGDPIVDRKSTFIAYACRVDSETDVSNALQELIECNSRLQRSSHNMYAFRLTEKLGNGAEVLKHDNDDDGEHGSGSKLAHLLQVRNDMNVVVMVARWYGGIHLGPKRFVHISNAARDLLARCDKVGWPES